ncbi:tRNA pseudouridine(55) synthase TruB [Vulcanisaeta sp. EB80]|jgi:tRNA pseudouridine synthase B (EC 4.2.1.70)|uniref:RNA-guided pseudouridylation complex pseudouridine synthase subunit Cbf5 n=1 Tax=Vulcanisaeta sp. EB80 TaxID=1650660 RepID=UPI000747A2EE|nr:RNA-guided pseudouridylation complex pseudouridine synthase subunit Cbf5 [Vulcanisaeta sp. EB80]KUO82003.1 MAG: H/ACA RNA-protein complex component Cbf5p [Vulcanisaeta sp. JCHS_4]MCG2866305.1 RNA-guided pseudouridylation complex pseudouridine synthase subunit Cbf5 [Vulcanisaeta sp.]MCG2885510.1 RNA-guided pseudouridylation complex pseudouridine synthase subunit Cbf5 [Vulcanisaeta sp.]MDT7969229.1 RNA-guided pseudouridylation complex pseudouridine synthase subunit Cbf5 [Vulcanisaeta sp.]PLC6
MIGVSLPNYCNEPEVLVKIPNEETNKEWGLPPENRSMDLYLRYGFIVIDKPRGPTSHEVAAWVKRILNLDRAGHSGTLDPGVSGVLPVALGESTKAMPAINTLDKEYIMVMKLHGDVDDDKLRAILKEFTGAIYQRPPLRSAVKRQVRVKHVYELELLERDGRYVLIRMNVESGTYARKLAYDIGEVLGVGANMRELRRVRVGCFTEKEAVKLQDLKDAYTLYKEYGVEDLLRTYVKPVEYMVRHLPKVWIRDSAVDAICHGAALAVPGIVKLTNNVKKGSLTAIMTLKNELVALGYAEMSSDDIMKAQKGIAVRTTRVVMRKGTYPPIWKELKEKKKAERKSETSNGKTS